MEPTTENVKAAFEEITKAIAAEETSSKQFLDKLRAEKGMVYQGLVLMRSALGSAAEVMGTQGVDIRVATPIYQMENIALATIIEGGGFDYNQVSADTATFDAKMEAEADRIDAFLTDRFPRDTMPAANTPLIALPSNGTVN